MKKTRCTCFFVLCTLLLMAVETHCQDYPKVTFVEALDTGNLKGLYPDVKEQEEIVSGMRMAEQFLKRMAGIDSLSLGERSNYKLLLEMGPVPNMHYEIVAVSAGLPHHLVFAINACMIFRNSATVLYKGAFELGIDVRQKQVVFPVYNPGYTKQEYFYICYQVKREEVAGLLPNLAKGNAYVAGWVQHLKKVCPDFVLPKDKIGYVIGDNSFEGYDYFGIHHCLSTSRFIKEYNTIVDVDARGDYKHEMIHALFSGYPMCRFLNEGLATFLSGGESKFGLPFADKLEAIRNRIRTDKGYAALLNTTDSLLDYSMTPEMYVIAALMLQYYHKKVGDAVFFKAVVHDFTTLKDEQAIDLLKRELGIGQVSDFVLAATIDSSIY